MLVFHDSLLCLINHATNIQDQEERTNQIHVILLIYLRYLETHASQLDSKNNLELSRVFYI